MIIFCLAMCLIISDDSLVLFYSNTPQLCNLEVIYRYEHLWRTGIQPSGDQRR